MEKNVFTVYQVNSYIKSVLEDDLCLNCIGIIGEISNFKNHPSGHLYFTLKDEYAAIRCVMFRSSANGLNFIPQNGMKVIIGGRVSLYDKTGDCQLYADYMQKAGTGVLFENFEKLKIKLMEEGLFDEERKRKIPSYVQCVAVVTSKSGAAVRDIIQIIRRRNKCIKIAVVPVQVQGANAAPQISQAINMVNAWGAADCIIVGRGGGSYEDLQAFNEEIVARSIVNSKIPVISAVGHETDFTIADFAADLRAPTPSAAAELVSFSLEEINLKVERNMFKINRAARIGLKQRLEKLESLKNRRVLKNPAECVYDRQIFIHSLQKRALTVVKNKIAEAKTLVKANSSAALNLSVFKTLSRGYAVITDLDGKVISGVSEIPRDKVKIIMRDGCVYAEITDIDKSAPEQTWLYS